MARITRHYDQEYKAQSLKLAKELGSVAKAATDDSRLMSYKKHWEESFHPPK